MLSLVILTSVTFILSSWVEPYGEQPVYISGDFNNWEERIPMKLYAIQNPEDPQHPKYEWRCVIPLSPGIHALRFIVQEQWRVDPRLPISQDENGREYNTITLKPRKLEPIKSRLIWLHQDFYLFLPLFSKR